MFALHWISKILQAKSRDTGLWPPGTVVPGRPYVLLQFFIFNAKSQRSLGR